MKRGVKPKLITSVFKHLTNKYFNQATMKKITLTLLLFCFTTALIAQEKRKEVGIEFSNLNSFGLTYKSGTSTSLWRYRILALNFGEQNQEISNSDVENYYYGGQIALGKEFRKSINNNLELKYGVEFGFSYQWQKNINKNNGYYEEKRAILSPAIIGVIGLNYVINEKIALGVELLPSLNYFSGNITNTQNNIKNTGHFSGYNFGFNNNSAKLSLSYRF